MRKILFLVAFIATISFANERAFISILKNVSIVDVNSAIKSAEELKKNFSDENFTELVKNWKRVEAIYLAGEIDENYLDTPRYIDIYHNLKEDLPTQMQRVINSKDEPKIALFKNSFKTINALEYLLYNDKTLTQREKELSIVVINSIVSNLKDIKEVYENYLNGEQKSENWENSVILNSLISSTYRLKEWRIGEPSGLAAKYKNDIKNERAEYFLSKNSFSAIKAILDAHESLAGNKSYYNFASMAKESNSKKEILEVQEAIKELKSELNNLTNDDFSQVKKLYKSMIILHNAYYLSLAEQLSVTAKILDADGD